MEEMCHSVVGVGGVWHKGVQFVGRVCCVSNGYGNGVG